MSNNSFLTRQLALVCAEDHITWNEVANLHFSLDLQALIDDGILQSNLKRSYEQIRESGQERELEDLIVGKSAAAQKLREEVLYAGQNKQAVFLNGETGTGKGLCARAIHDFGRRQEKSFVRYQPTFGTGDMVSSDLFGHSKGAFTGAIEDRRGLIEVADGGSLFLDEIDELPLETQVLLLGVLQDKVFRPVGSTVEKQADFRLISASNRDVEKCIEDGKLRRDFFHRIAHFKIELPALKERKDDLESLAAHCLSQLQKSEELSVYEIEASALERLQSYEWPGNVRELQAVIEGAAYRSEYAGRNSILTDDLNLGKKDSVSKSELTFSEQVEAFKRKLIEDALAHNDGNQVKAAKSLGLDRSSMRRILARGSK